MTDFDGNTVIDNSPTTISAFKPNTAYTMTYMMQNAVENGTGREARLYNMSVAGKTGTSGDYKDRWFCGVTPYYVAAVWTGFDTPATINVSGNPAAQLWKKVMQPLHDGLEYKAFTYPYIGGNTGIFGIQAYTRAMTLTAAITPAGATVPAPTALIGATPAPPTGAIPILPIGAATGAGAA